MNGIAMGRVIGAGLLAGVVINIFEFVLNVFILGAQWEQTMKAMNLPSEFSGTQIAWFNIMGFVIGILTVWVYAAFLPRFGAGSRTAVLSGLTVYLLGYFLPSMGYLIMGLFPAKLVCIGLAVGLVEILTASIIGSKAYKEAEGSAVKAAGA